VSAERVLLAAVVVSVAYLAVVYTAYIVLVVVGAFENRLRRHESAAEDYDTIAASRFTIPVSVIAPAFNEEAAIVDSVRSLLAFDYPEFEVIVVNDGSTDRTMDVLADTYALEPYELFTRSLFPSAEVHGVFRSAVEPRPRQSTRRTAARRTASTQGSTSHVPATCVVSIPTRSSSRTRCSRRCASWWRTRRA
jgi:cellulose synthase/poly-beta-1,6-N-acetylglucosamine synthase-like glycosyltransferase